MTFAWPHLLWLLVAPAALLVFELSRRRRAAAAPAHPKILRAEAGTRDLSLMAHAAPVAIRAGARPWLAAGLALAIVSLARPQWGRLEQPVFEQSREILLAIDLSRSMLAPDVKPTRLDRAKLLIQSLLEKLEGERVGLVVFSGTAFLQSPLSADYEILREFLPALDPEFLPEGGTHYGALIRTSLEAFGSASAADRFLIILSDGEATDENWREQMQALQKKSIRVIGLGVGTSAGAMIPDSAGGFVKDERGAVVLSKLESATLQELAAATGGVYRDASDWIDLAAVLRDTVEAGRKGEFVETNTVRMVERFQWPLALALWCLLVSLCYEFPVRPRPREIALRTGTPGKEEREKTVPAATMLLLLLLFVFSFLATAPAHAARLAEPPSVPEAAADEPSPLARIVGRLAAAETHTARDWAELARETVAWGTRLQSHQQPVPEGPVRDALAAVDTGSKLNPKTTDWPKLREELEALLEKPEDQQQQDQQQQQQNQEQQQNEQQSGEQDQSGQQQQQDQSGSPQDQSSPQNQEQKDGEQKPPGEPAFGDMNEKEAPPPPSGDTQKVGGAQEKRPEQQEPIDPALTLPLQKLEQLRNQDSPAELFQMMEPDKKPAQKSGKNW